MATKKLQIVGNLVEVDATLQETGKAADAKAVSDAIESLKDTYIGDDTVSNQINTAINELSTDVAYIDPTDNETIESEIASVKAVLYTPQVLTESQKAQARNNIGLNNISLGIASDGLIYLFVNGEPVGDGVPCGETADIYGYVDENNHIVLKGVEKEGQYTFAFEAEDGSTIHGGTFEWDDTVYYSVTKNLTYCTINNGTTQVVEGDSYSATVTANDGYELKSVSVTMGGNPVSVSGGVISIANVTGNIVITAVATEAQIEPAYTNLLPLAVDASGNDYAGTNGEDGYNTNNKISVSSGNESSASACVSGFIKLPEGVQSTIRIKNITVSSAASINNVVFYNANKEKMNGYAGLAGSFNSDITVTDGIYQILTRNWFTNDNIPAYFRFSCGEITAETIVTVNEEIV